jgi:hypothetical protein
LKGKLGDSGDQDPPRQGHDGLVHEGGQPEGAGNERQVEQDRGEGWDPETPEGIEDAPGQGGQRDEQEIGEGQAQHLRGEHPLPRDIRKAGGEDDNQERRRQDPGRRHHQECCRQGPRRVVDEALEVLGPPPGLVLREDRNEGEGKGPFGKQAAHQVRDAEGDEEGVGPRIGAEDPSHDQIAKESEDPGDQGVSADLGEGSGEWGQGSELPSK